MKQSFIRHLKTVFVPSRGFLFFYASYRLIQSSTNCFRPLTGISLFLSICSFVWYSMISFRPLTGISLFLWQAEVHVVSKEDSVFVPSRGFLFFYLLLILQTTLQCLFSSPHGDFSFSIIKPILGCEVYFRFRPLTGISLFLSDNSVWTDKKYDVFVPSRGFLFFYPISYSPYKSRAIFIICGANIFKPSECYF